METGEEPAVATVAQEAQEVVEEEPRHRRILKGQMVETQEMRCPKCGRFLGWQAVIWGLVKVKCTNSKCKEWITLDIRPDA
ncbi:MAG: hypothetical protein PHE59_04805 [Patescibacteria group bacterium]|nr:hypothetical protein [Patescibacteria group bacterium]